MTDVALGFDAELRHEMLCVLDRLTEEIFGNIFNKFMILQTSTPFLHRQICLMIIMIDCQLGEVDEDIEKREFFAERKRLQYFFGSFRKR